MCRKTVPTAVSMRGGHGVLGDLAKVFGVERPASNA